MKPTIKWLRTNVIDPIIVTALIFAGIWAFMEGMSRWIGTGR